MSTETAAATRPEIMVREAVHPDVSDLFFNSDLDECKAYDDPNGPHAGWHLAELREAAAQFLAALDRLTVIGLPTPEGLVQDFLRRV